MKNVNRQKQLEKALKKSSGKKTTHCSEVEILARIDRLIEINANHERVIAEQIEELLEEWKHS